MGPTMMQDDEVLIDAQEGLEQDFEDDDDAMDDEDPTPAFPRLAPSLLEDGKPAIRRIPVPPHRYTPLRNDWLKICSPIVNNMKLQIRMNPKQRQVEIRTSEHTEEIGSLQKSADFLKAYMMGFEVEDAVALLRLDDIYIDSFEVEDVKMLHGEHISRAIGRIAGKDGRTKFAIENATKTRIVVAYKKIHIMGSFANIKIARDAICALIMGS